MFNNIITEIGNLTDSATNRTILEIPNIFPRDDTTFEDPPLDRGTLIFLVSINLILSTLMLFIFIFLGIRAAAHVNRQQMSKRHWPLFIPLVSYAVTLVCFILFIALKKDTSRPGCFVAPLAGL